MLCSFDPAADYLRGVVCSTQPSYNPSPLLTTFNIDVWVPGHGGNTLYGIGPSQSIVAFDDNDGIGFATLKINSDEHDSSTLLNIYPGAGTHNLIFSFHHACGIIGVNVGPNVSLWKLDTAGCAFLKHELQVMDLCRDMLCTTRLKINSHQNGIMLIVYMAPCD